MTTIWWVRHGPTHEKAFTGWRDVPADLSDIAALQRLSDYLPDDAVVISSDLSRARATADAIQGNRRRVPHDPDLREFDFGLWDGQHWSDVAKGYPTLSRQYWEEPGDVAPPDGESWNAAQVRVDAATDRLIELNVPHIIAVAHFGTILTQIRRANALTPYQALAHKIDNLSVTRIADKADPINHLA